AKVVWERICRSNEHSEYSEIAPLRVSRRDAHQQNRRLFKRARDIDPMLQLLADWGYLRLIPSMGEAVRGHSSPVYFRNPLALGNFKRADPHTHCTHCTHLRQSKSDSEYSECSESAPSPVKNGEEGEVTI